MALTNILIGTLRVVVNPLSIFMSLLLAAVVGGWLGSHADPRFDPVVRQLLEGQEWGILEERGKLDQLIAMGHSATPTLVRVAGDRQEEPLIRVRAIYTLGVLRATEGVAPLGEIIRRDRDRTVRGEAARALGAIGAPEGLSALIVAASDADFFVREQAVIALGKLRVTAAVPILRAVQQGDPMQHVRDAAREALAGITGQ
jgi:HEAT repeat protein